MLPESLLQLSSLFMIVVTLLVMLTNSGILISQQAVCRFMDTDSFQIRLGNKVYYCEVGTLTLHR
jgi:hypothetical protein